MQAQSRYSGPSGAGVDAHRVEPSMRGHPADAVAAADDDLGHDQHARLRRVVGERERAEADESGAGARHLVVDAAPPPRSVARSSAASCTRFGPRNSSRSVSPSPTTPSPRRRNSSGRRASSSGSSERQVVDGASLDRERHVRGARRGVRHGSSLRTPTEQASRPLDRMVLGEQGGYGASGRMKWPACSIDVAPGYDRTNIVLSVRQRGALARRHAARAIDPKPGERILDVAAGTGTSVRRPRAARRDGRRRRLLAGHDRGGPQAQPEASSSSRRDATKLPFGDDEFDAVTISFGLRNVDEPKVALAEMYRVLKPGGRLVICEFSHPPRRSCAAATTPT